MSDFDPTGVKPYIPKKGNKDAVTAAPACAGDDCDISLDAAPVSGTSAATSGKDFPLPGILQFITELVDESGKPVPKEEMLGLHNKVVGWVFSSCSASRTLCSSSSCSHFHLSCLNIRLQTLLQRAMVPTVPSVCSK